MELKDLIGGGVLDAVDFTSEAIKDHFGDYQNCSVCRFRLNGTIYIAIEDPEDGYRSCMRDLIVGDETEIKNCFEPINVVGVHFIENCCESCDILYLIDIATGKIVLEVGTVRTSDYYPCYVASFHPENMCINQDRGEV